MELPLPIVFLVVTGGYAWGAGAHIGTEARFPTLGDLIGAGVLMLLLERGLRVDGFWLEVPLLLGLSALVGLARHVLFGRPGRGASSSGSRDEGARSGWRARPYRAAAAHTRLLLAYFYFVALLPFAAATRLERTRLRGFGRAPPSRASFWVRRGDEGTTPEDARRMA